MSPLLLTPGSIDSVAALKALKNIDATLSRLPHIRNIADISARIVDIRDRVSSDKKLSFYLIDRVATHSTTLFTALKQAKQNEEFGIQGCEQDLQRYEALLNDIHQVLCSVASTGIRKILLIKDRNEIRNKLGNCSTQLDAFDGLFKVSRLTSRLTYNVTDTSSDLMSPNPNFPAFVRQTSLKASIMISKLPHPVSANASTVLKIIKDGSEALSDVPYIRATWQDAENLPVLERHKVLGEEHHDTLKSMHSLAVTYQTQGRWKEAEDLFLLVLERQKKVLGEDHHDTVVTMTNLAAIYQSQGRWKEAEGLHLAVLERWTKALGERHPDTLTTMSNLALTYWSQGRWKESGDLHLAALEWQRKILGEEHPDTLKNMNNLALTYGSQGRWKEAEGLFLAVIKKGNDIFGEEHPDTLKSMNNLAVTYQSQGKWKEAEGLFLAALERQSKILGEKHPDTLMSMSNLVAIYHIQSRLMEAEELMTTVLESRRKVLGEEHPDTVTSMKNLAMIYHAQDRLKEAEELLEAVDAINGRVLAGLKDIF